MPIKIRGQNGVYDMPWDKPSEPNSQDIDAFLSQVEPKSAIVKKPKAPSLWEKANTPLTTYPSKIASQLADYETTPKLDDKTGLMNAFTDPMHSAEFKGFVGGATKEVGDLASSFTSPFNIGLTALSMGAGTAGRIAAKSGSEALAELMTAMRAARTTDEAAKIAEAANKIKSVRSAAQTTSSTLGAFERGGMGAIAGEAAYKGIRDKDLSQAGPLAMGLLGMRSHGPVIEPRMDFEDVGELTSADKRLDELRNKPPYQSQRVRPVDRPAYEFTQQPVLPGTEPPTFRAVKPTTTGPINKVDLANADMVKTALTLPSKPKIKIDPSKPGEVKLMNVNEDTVRDLQNNGYQPGQANLDGSITFHRENPEIRPVANILSKPELNQGELSAPPQLEGPKFGNVKDIRGRDLGTTEQKLPIESTRPGELVHGKFEGMPGSKSFDEMAKSYDDQITTRGGKESLGMMKDIEKEVQAKRAKEKVNPETGEITSEEMRVPGTSNIALGGASPRVLDVLGTSLYSGDRPTVVSKELLQNAFDEHRIAKVNEPDAYTMAKANLDERHAMGEVVDYEDELDNLMQQHGVINTISKEDEILNAAIRKAHDRGDIVWNEKAPQFKKDLQQGIIKVTEKLPQGYVAVSHVKPKQLGERIDESTGEIIDEDKIETDRIHSIQNNLAQIANTPERTGTVSSKDLVKATSNPLHRDLVSNELLEDIKQNGIKPINIRLKRNGINPKEGVDIYGENYGTSGELTVDNDSEMTLAAARKLNIENVPIRIVGSLRESIDSTGISPYNKLYDSSGKLIKTEPIKPKTESEKIDISKENKELVDKMPEDALKDFIERNTKNPGYDSPTGKNLLNYANSILENKVNNPAISINKELPKEPPATNLTIEDKANIESWYKFKKIYDSGKMTALQMQQWGNIHNKVKDLKPNGSFEISPHRFETPPSEEPEFTSYTLPDGKKVMLSTSATKGAEKTTFQLKSGEIVEATKDSEIKPKTLREKFKSEEGSVLLEPPNPKKIVTTNKEFQKAKGEKELSNFRNELIDKVNKGVPKAKHKANIDQLLREKYKDLEGDFDREDHTKYTGEENSKIRSFMLLKGLQHPKYFEKFFPNASPKFVEDASNLIDLSRGKTNQQITKYIDNYAKTGNFELPKLKSVIHNKGITGRFGSESGSVLLEPKSIVPKKTKPVQPSFLNPFDVMSATRSFMAGPDLSMPLRQGSFMVTRPQFWKSLEPMMKGAGSEKYFQDAMKGMERDRNFQKARDAGLKLTGLDDMNNREESIISNLPERIPILGKAYRGSNRAATLFINKLRFDTFKSVSEGVKDPEAIKALASYINNATGRGDLKAKFGGYKIAGKELPKKEYDFEGAASALNTIFFSPRFAASRMRLLSPGYYIKMNPVARKEALRDLAGSVLALNAVLGIGKLAGAKVGLDPTSADFGKMIIGNTRIDFTGGFGPYVRLAAQLVRGEKTSSLTGKTSKFNTGKYGAPTKMDAVTQFMQSKEAPVTSFLTDYLKGKEQSGEPFEVKKAVTERFTPMIMQDMYDIMKDDPKKFPAIIPGILGAGVQTYGKRTVKRSLTSLPRLPSIH